MSHLNPIPIQSAFIGLQENFLKTWGLSSCSRFFCSTYKTELPCLCMWCNRWRPDQCLPVKSMSGYIPLLLLCPTSGPWAPHVASSYHCFHILFSLPEFHPLLIRLETSFQPSTLSLYFSFSEKHFWSSSSITLFLRPCFLSPTLSCACFML